MREIINITPQETKELYDRMITVGSTATIPPSSFSKQQMAQPIQGLAPEAFQYDRMITVGSRRLTGLPSSWNPQAGEDRMVKSLDTLDAVIISCYQYSISKGK